MTLSIATYSTTISKASVLSITILSLRALDEQYYYAECRKQVFYAECCSALSGCIFLYFTAINFWKLLAVNSSTLQMHTLTIYCDISTN
jgi:hypothetical protein